VAAIERVLVRSQTGNTPTWESEFSLGDNTSAALFEETTPVSLPSTISPQNTTLSAPVQSVQTPATHVSSDVSSGMVLLPKLSEVNRSLQQYQDVIIRLTDDSGSQIICLCTLAELIQSLHTPNAQLQYIADAIAKCSSVNPDGERIIRNVSILQPGQAWQKTQIRCVLQVFFEMGSVGEMNFSRPAAPEPEVRQAPPADDTVIETTEAITSAEETVIEVDAGTDGKSDSKSESDETLIEAVSQAPELPNQPVLPEQSFPSDPLFNEFNFTMIAPVKSVTDIDTISGLLIPDPSEESLSLTLEEFSRDLLTGVS